MSSSCSGVYFSVQGGFEAVMWHCQYLFKEVRHISYLYQLALQL